MNVFRFFLLVSFALSSSLYPNGLDIQVPGAPVPPKICLEQVADSVQAYVNLVAQIKKEEKHQVPNVDLKQLNDRLREQAAQVRQFASNCSELLPDSRTNILDALKEDERYYRKK